MDGDNLKILFFSGVTLCVGLSIFYGGFTALTFKRLIENTPTSKIRSIAMGLVELFGKAIPYKDTLESPFSKSECLYYSYEIEEYKQRGKNSSWVTVQAGGDAVLFNLRDDTGEVLINPVNAEVDIPTDNIFDSGMGCDPPALVASFLKQENLDFEGFLGINKTMRYTEKFISPDDDLYILGTAGDNPFVEDRSVTEGHRDIMISKGHKAVYYIADRAEKKILNKKKWQIPAMLAGGVLLTVSGLSGILWITGLFNG